MFAFEQVIAAGRNRVAVAYEPRRILIVEDDETLALLMKYNIEAQGHRVDWLSRGDAVEPLVTESEFDLIILDWKLPGRSGLDLCRWLRGHVSARRVPIIMATALTDADDRDAAISAGADIYLAKPFTMATLIERMRLLIKTR
jgi:two-component system phosphate regulon response regulator PhoB